MADRKIQPHEIWALLRDKRYTFWRWGVDEKERRHTYMVFDDTDYEQSGDIADRTIVGYVRKKFVDSTRKVNSVTVWNGCTRKLGGDFHSFPAWEVQTQDCKTRAEAAKQLHFIALTEGFYVTEKGEQV